MTEITRPNPLEPSLRSLERYWDEDARTYNAWPEHVTRSSVERAAWTRTLARMLPTGGHVLDVGAGTGFLSLTAARLGCRVTACDVSAGMLARLRESVAGDDLPIEIVHAPAHEPPPGPFDAVMERLTLWTLPNPDEALARWREVAPGGRLLVFEANWGDLRGFVRRRWRELLRRRHGLPPEHHGAYGQELCAELPLLGVSPGALVDRVESAGWQHVGIERLRDVEWAELVALSRVERLFGVTPEYAISASAAPPRQGA